MTPILIMYQLVGSVWEQWSLSMNQCDLCTYCLWGLGYIFNGSQQEPVYVASKVIFDTSTNFQASLFKWLFWKKNKSDRRQWLLCQIISLSNRENAPRFIWYTFYKMGQCNPSLFDILSEYSYEKCWCQLGFSHF